MNKKIFFILIPLLLLTTCILLYLKYTEKEKTNQILNHTTLTKTKIVFKDKSQIEVEVANTNESRELGLGQRSSLPENSGMLFDFSYTKNALPSFWMKDMLFPIDIIWIRDNKIISINENIPAPKNSNDDNLLTYQPPGYIDYVLEVNSGYTKKHNIKIGDSIDIFPKSLSN